MKLLTISLLVTYAIDSTNGQAVIFSCGSDTNCTSGTDRVDEEFCVSQSGNRGFTEGECLTRSTICGDGDIKTICSDTTDYDFILNPQGSATRAEGRHARDPDICDGVASNDCDKYIDGGSSASNLVVSAVTLGILLGSGAVLSLL